jgi:glycosyltransferase involved in cell wall biosynthesis
MTPVPSYPKLGTQSRDAVSASDDPTPGDVSSGGPVPSPYAGSSYPTGGGGGGAGAAYHPTLYAWGPRQRRAPEWGEAQGGPEPLRVIHVGPCLNRGGAEQWLVELLRFLDPARVRVDRAIAVLPHGVDPTFAADLPLPIEVGGAEAVRRAARECDVLLSWGVPLDELLDGTRPPLSVFIAHGDGAYTIDLVGRSRRHADHVVAVSGRVRDLTCDGLPTTVIYNGIDAARLARTRPRDEVRRALGFNPGDFVLGYLGRLSPEKRPGAVIEAVAGLPPHFKALVVGWGPLLRPLMDLANRLIPGRYAFLTATEYLGDYYAAMDAFCLLGTEEGFSLAMLEAMMCERPLIVTPVGVVPELIVDRVNGLIVDPNAESVRLAAERLSRHPHWAAGLAAEAKSFADREGHAVRMARDYEDLLWRLWSARPATAPAPPQANGHAAPNGHAHPSRNGHTARPITV